MRILVTKTYVLLYFAIATVIMGSTAYSQEEPQVPFKYGLGMDKYQLYCSSCHGKWAKGSDQGPPLIHGYYRSSHHGDESFYRAALNGARQHHWDFGDMPPVPDINRQDVDAIVPFVRWLQQEAGLE
jgi:hypothetical protein